MEAKSGAAGGFAPVLTALRTMQSNVAGKDKADAHEFLEKFQKSSEAWNATHAILQDFSIPVEARLFAATTLKGKVRRPLPVQGLLPDNTRLSTIFINFLRKPSRHSETPSYPYFNSIWVVPGRSGRSYAYALQV
jgi:hypothetical protein